jgi:hypothetical protein
LGRSKTAWPVNVPGDACKIQTKNLSGFSFLEGFFNSYSLLFTRQKDRHMNDGTLNPNKKSGNGCDIMARGGHRGCRKTEMRERSESSFL